MHGPRLAPAFLDLATFPPVLSRYLGLLPGCFLRRSLGPYPGCFFLGYWGPFPDCFLQRSLGPFPGGFYFFLFDNVPPASCCHVSYAGDPDLLAQVSTRLGTNKQTNKAPFRRWRSCTSPPTYGNCLRGRLSRLYRYSCCFSLLLCLTNLPPSFVFLSSPFCHEDFLARTKLLKVFVTSSPPAIFYFVLVGFHGKIPLFL